MFYNIKVIQNPLKGKEINQKNPLKMVFFVIKKKIFKKAVDRNRVKRRARKAFKDVIDAKIKEGQADKIYGFFNKYKIIFFLEHDMIRALYSNIVLQISKDIENTFKK